MTEYRDHHATIFVAPAIAGPIEAVRREWDPAMAAQIAAHVTVAYPQEAPISDLLVERVRAASAGIPPFRLRLGRVATFESSEDGVYVTVEDIDGTARCGRKCCARRSTASRFRRTSRLSIRGRRGAAVTFGTAGGPDAGMRSSWRRK
jgi:2'-5' RNA ligase superfamily